MLLYYFRSLLKDKLVLDWALLLHLIPAFVILLNTLPYYGVPFAEKMEFAAQVQADDPSRENNFPYLLFHYRWQKLFLPGYNLLYALISITYAFRVRQQGTFYVKRRVWFLLTRVALVFGIYFSPIFFFILYSTIINPENYELSFTNEAYQNNGFLYFNTLILPISFLLMPKVLYGEKQKESTLESIWASIKDFFARRYPDSAKPSSESEAVEQIVSYLEQAKPYLKDDFSQHDLSIALNIPQKRITECFNKQLKVSFPLYRNTLRIRHATELLREGAHLTTSIEGIAERSGFKSKSAFYLAFKAVHGIRPVDWIKENL
jgi:AraC-like DNA-binding protein